MGKICKCKFPGKGVVSSPLDTVDTCQTCGKMILGRYIAKVGTHSSEPILVISGTVKNGERIKFRRCDETLAEGIITKYDIGLDLIFIELF